MCIRDRDIISTFPRELTAVRPNCPNQGYSDCGPDEYRRAEGTSFAAPQVSAAAALVLAVKPWLAPDQVAALLTRTAVDANATNGCRRCPLLRDSLSGWGRLNILAAVTQTQQGTMPPADRFEANDDAGTMAPQLWGAKRTLTATIDYWDDANDVYRVRVREGEKLTVTLKGPAKTDTNLALWRPGTKHVEGLSVALQQMRVQQSARPGSSEQIRYTPPARGGGWHYLQVKISTPGAGSYTLSFSKS